MNREKRIGWSTFYVSTKGLALQNFLNVNNFQPGKFVIVESDQPGKYKIIAVTSERKGHYHVQEGRASRNSQG